MNRQLKAEMVLVYGSQADAAVALDLAKSRLSRIIRGHVKASRKERRILARALGADRIDLLLGGNERRKTV